MKTTVPRTELIQVPAAHPVFDGHFPHRPVLPGSLLLAFIVDAWARPVARVARVKFLKTVLPGDRLTLTFSLSSTGSGWHFLCQRRGVSVCTGLLLQSDDTG